jgi:hypothetical protein
MTTENDKCTFRASLVPEHKGDLIDPDDGPISVGGLAVKLGLYEAPNEGAAAKADTIAEMDACPPNGTCYDMDDARRALADRPSLERELTALRHQAELHLARCKRDSDLLVERWSRIEELEADNARLRERVKELQEDAAEIAELIVRMDKMDRPLVDAEWNFMLDFARAALKMEGGGKE